MRTRLAIFLMIGATAAGLYSASTLRETPEILKQAEAAAAGIDMETTASIGPRKDDQPRAARVFKLASPEASTSCMITRGEELTPGYAPLNVNKGCDEIHPGLSNVKFWREREDGSIAFMDAENSAVAEFAFGDGVDYESYQPASALLSLWAEQ